MDQEAPVERFAISEIPHKRNMATALSVCVWGGQFCTPPEFEGGMLCTPA